MGAQNCFFKCRLGKALSLTVWWFQHFSPRLHIDNCVSDVNHQNGIGYIPAILGTGYSLLNISIYIIYYHIHTAFKKVRNPS
jgi:hypothetical protein